MNEPEYLTVDEYAKKMRVSRQHIYRMCEKGLVQHVRVGQTIRIPRSVLEPKVTT